MHRLMSPVVPVRVLNPTNPENFQPRHRNTVPKKDIKAKNNPMKTITGSVLLEETPENLHGEAIKFEITNH